MQRASQSARRAEASRPARGALTAGIDIGTTTVKAVVVDDEGHIVERRAVPSRLGLGPGGQLEHDARLTWWEAPRQVLADLLAVLGPEVLSAVAVAAFMPSVTAVDAQGCPLGPGLLYGDSRGQGAWGQGGPGATGDPTATDEMARLARWAAGEVPGAAGYWPAQAVANASLGGEGVVDLASAFAAGSLFGGSGWDEAACRSAGLAPGHLPRVAMFGEAVGRVGWPELSAPSGDGRPPPDVVLAAGSVDGLCEQLVAGAVQDGDVLVSLGSTLVVWLTVPGWPSQAPGLWRVPHLVAGKAMVGGASNAGGIWVDWVERLLGPGDGQGAESLRPDDVPIWWPWARGERVPLHDPGLRASLSGAGLAHGPGALRRGALEATGFVVRHILELASASGTRPGRALVSGGGVRNRAWLQALADVLGQPVVPAAASEGAARGAAFLARMALGLHTSLDDARRWAAWSTPVQPRPEWAAAAARRYEAWLAGLPERRAVPGKEVS